MMTTHDDIQRRVSMHDDNVGLHTAVSSRDDEQQWMMMTMTTKCSRKYCKPRFAN